MLLVAGASLTVQAQTKMPPRKPVAPRQKVVIKGETMKDGAIMKEGKVFFTQQGQTSPVTQPVSLVNGTKIMADGSLTMADGTTAMLREGDVLSLSGRLTTMAMKAEQDSLALMAKYGKKGKLKMKTK
ncbi:hypothetical protein GCM10022406_23610 [Hymenobacter algoricola]|uniref:DUF6799 domain-containing protein n=1 Tax=Hymenobacter algoricola TaxID=486267 RepID=A0ABP7N915_9BACT